MGPVKEVETLVLFLCCSGELPVVDHHVMLDSHHAQCGGDGPELTPQSHCRVFPRSNSLTCVGERLWFHCSSVVPQIEVESRLDNSNNNSNEYVGRGGGIDLASLAA